MGLLLFANVLIGYAQQDVDHRIAVTTEKDDKSFVLIISNENYKYEQPVPFALNDGETFKLYCEKTFGIPSKNIRFLKDATLNDIRMQIQWLQKVMDAYEGEARAIIYYSGHGMPSEDGNKAYLLPVDGKSTLTVSGLSTSDLYAQLSDMPSKRTLVILDACFSGARRDGLMLASSRGVAIKTKQAPISGNMVVFSAAQGDETAYPLHEERHGLFTYYILEEIQRTGGLISLGELSDNVKKNVTRASIVENDKSQTPTIVASPLSKDWKNWSFAMNRATKYETINRETNNNETQVKRVSNDISIENKVTIDSKSLQDLPHENDIHITDIIDHPFGILSLSQDASFKQTKKAVNNLYPNAKIDIDKGVNSIDIDEKSGFNKCYNGIPLNIFCLYTFGSLIQTQIWFDFPNGYGTKENVINTTHEIEEQLLNLGYYATVDTDKTDGFIYAKKIKKGKQELGLYGLEAKGGGYTIWIMM